MTRKEFKSAMVRGLGRCIIAVQQNPEKYRDIVLWACKRDIAFDAQSEGTRSWYVYRIASCYPDKETFINATAEALRKYRATSGWNLLHFSEILMFFAADGYISAQQALEDKYQECLAAMFARKRRPNRIFHELSDLEQLGLVLVNDSKSFIRVAHDYGRLYREKRFMQDGDFLWFFDSKGNQYRTTMERVAKIDPDVSLFMQRQQAWKDNMEQARKQRSKIAPEGMRPILLSRWLKKKASTETILQYANTYRQQTDPDLRSKALQAFHFCPYPDDPQTIIDDTKSDYEPLRSEAWCALENLRHPIVRAFALANAHSGIHTPEIFALLTTNYLPEDAKIMETIMQKIIETNDGESIHMACADVLRTFYKDSGIPNPKPTHLLPILYEHTPCSFCREGIIVRMSRHRMLTQEILEECLYDSYYDIRHFAEKKLHK